MKPVIIVNFKAYREGVAKIDEIVKSARYIIETDTAEIYLAPPLLYASRIVDSGVSALAQHTDAISYGSHTGRIPPEMIKLSGLKGSLINHSENRLTLADIEFITSRLKELDLLSVICTNNIATSRSASAIEPDYVAVEPPELIGSGIPVSKAEPEIVEGSVRAVKEVNPSVRVLCGAGISEYEDLVSAIELGADGVLLASGVIKDRNPGKKLKELAGV